MGIARSPGESPTTADEPQAPGAAPRLSSRELRRRFWHMAPGLLPFLLWPIPHADPISPTLRAIMVVLAIGLGAWIFANFRRIARSHVADNRFQAVAGYAGSVLLMLLLFPAHAELGLTVLAVLAFGDGSATLGGLLLGGPRVPWNSAKTLSGMGCFVLVGGLMAAMVYWGETHNLEAQTPGVDFATALVCGVSTAAAGAFVESLPSRINDNIRVGGAACVTILAVQSLVVGWA